MPVSIKNFLTKNGLLPQCVTQEVSYIYIDLKAFEFSRQKSVFDRLIYFAKTNRETLSICFDTDRRAQTKVKNEKY